MTLQPLTDDELPALRGDAAIAERIKTLMHQAGMPDSTSIYSAFRQFQNEMERDAVQIARQAAEAQRLKSEQEIVKAKAREWIDAVPTVMALTARIAELEARCAELEKDAARYRYLRENCSYSYGMQPDSPAEHGIEYQWVQGTYEERHHGIGTTIDAAIAALETKP